MTASLIVIAGPLRDAIVPLEGEMKVGREPGCAISIPDSALSRYHCSFRYRDKAVVVEDLGSRNGTFVNGLPVKEKELQPGDQIQAGNSAFLFRVDGSDSRYSPHAGADDIPESTIVLKPEESAYLARPEVSGRQLENRLRLLVEIGRDLPAKNGLEAVAAELLRLARQAVNVRHIALLGEERVIFGDPVFGDSEAHMLPAPVLRKVFAENIALHIDNAMAAPMAANGKVFAVLHAVCAGSALDSGVLDLLAAIATVAAPALENAMLVERLEAANRDLLSTLRMDLNMIGDSPAMGKAYDIISRTAPAETTVLVLGESGTGKELAARAIHRNSRRKDKPFVAINCAALAETLLESELFGHEKGAFTGAVSQTKGKIEEAAGGTLFLDEVGEMAPILQAKLLRVLQEREFERVGGSKPIKADIRLIAATNRNLEEMVKEKTFRQDLYYRLNVISLRMPALRERRQDIPSLARHFTAKYAARTARRVAGISEEALRCLMAYEWPGNVRELENAIERAVVLGGTDTVLPEDLPGEVTQSAAATVSGGHDFQALVHEAKKHIVLEALDQSGNRYAEAARLLGLHPSNLHRLMRNLGMRIEIPRP